MVALMKTNSQNDSGQHRRRSQGDRHGIEMTRVNVQPAPNSETADEETKQDSRQTPPKRDAKKNLENGETLEMSHQTPLKKGAEKDVKNGPKICVDNDDDTTSGSQPVDGDEEELFPAMCGKHCSPRHSKACRIIFFLTLFGLDVLDLFSDWLLFADVSITEEGLVYGPPGNSVTYALLAFSIVGTVTFLFEGVNLWWEVFREDPWLDVDLVSAVTIWVEDLPQIAINVYIAYCREDPISVFQLSKASVVLLGLLIRIIISSVKYCNKKALAEANSHTPESKRHVAFRVFIMLGLLINSGCAVTVFVFTQTQRDTNGNIIFQVPETLFEDSYNDQRYFQNVSVFIHHPDFDVSAPTSATNYQANWVRFMSINDIRDRSDLHISYNYVYEKTATHLKMALYVKEDTTGSGRQGSWKVSECYNLDLASHQIVAVNSATCQSSFFSPQAVSVYLTFSFTPPDRLFKKYIFGDIRFNVRVYNNQVCSEYTDFGDSVSDSTTIPIIHYYRTSATLAPGDMRHLLIKGGTPRFYSNDGADLQDVTQVWKTGFGRCESSGSKAPHFQQDIPIQCSNNAVPSITG
ncbi:uncharacterized protein LOC143288600 [Babylonia areolata]|uniref:uncharacterized protein LOC143288600 n=1 Tax=Babylonia areolata TaxID=304850 RepID=UPI003FD34AA6